MPAIQLTVVPPSASFALAVHGGAGPLHDGSERAAEQAAGLRAALDAGEAVLTAGGAALDAVCAAVAVLEDDEAFNAGRGAALTVDGTAELDACVCDGATGLAGAVAASRFARHPVLAGRAVMEHTPHVLLAAPTPQWLDQVHLERVDPTWFVTPARLAALRAGTAEATAPAVAPGTTGPAVTPPRVGHGTVGAVARDSAGRLAAATSTGGVTGQWAGRIGDTPVVGAGTWADGRVAVSGTGIGEYFLRAALAHDIAARVRWTGAALADAVRDAIADDLVVPGGDGGIIAAGADGTLVLAYCSEAMLRAYLGPDGPVVVA